MSIFKSHLVAMSAYAPPIEGRNPKSHLLLDFNERTLPISHAIQSALIEFIKNGHLQMYPSYGDIVERIAAYAKVDASQLMITNGSDQGIDLVIRAACREGDEVIIPSPSFAMYKQVAGVENARVIEPVYTREKGFPTQQVLEAINDRTRVIAIANPNNPSGTTVSREDIVIIAKAAPHAAVLVDECYFEYCGISVCDLVAQYKNIVVTRTFSKTWGIPSLRLGYIVSAEENIRTLLNIRGPYDVNQLAIVAIKAALENIDTIKSYVSEVMERSKPRLEKHLLAKNIDFWPSGGNFIWLFPEDPDEVEAKLRDEGVLIRPKKDADGNVGLRVTIGTVEQTERLIALL